MATNYILPSCPAGAGCPLPHKTHYTLVLISLVPGPWSLVTGRTTAICLLSVVAGTMSHAAWHWRGARGDLAYTSTPLHLYMRAAAAVMVPATI